MDFVRHVENSPPLCLSLVSYASCKSARFTWGRRRSRAEFRSEKVRSVVHDSHSLFCNLWLPHSFRNIMARLVQLTADAKLTNPPPSPYVPRMLSCETTATSGSAFPFSTYHLAFFWCRCWCLYRTLFLDRSTSSDGRSCYSFWWS